MHKHFLYQANFLYRSNLKRLIFIFEHNLILYNISTRLKAHTKTVNIFTYYINRQVSVKPVKNHIYI
jgi:hypothetical protein